MGITRQHNFGHRYKAYRVASGTQSNGLLVNPSEGKLMQNVGFVNH